MRNRRSIKLVDAMRDRRLIRFSRRFEESSVRGYVFDIGPRFFLLALVSDRIWFDGFECFRLHDVSDVRPDPYATFTKTALRKRSDRIPRKPRVSLASIEELLLSANRAFPLVTVHREQRDPAVCFIGRVVGIDRGRVSLLQINPDATWEKKPTDHQLSEITRVNFGGDYEDALAIVAGSPPQADIRLETDLRTRSKGSRASAAQP